ncbi:hypothetical protein PROFUN_01201 [Planoprotostelium fungivorum]|uniref:F-box domain-containing protein n=1 Tax=Planoprotostelium fungivorum TaxID=1890364 RepID=A0A2P6NCK1_9EUKA|nr:hypothetical protein PROFUN_01201 [Planoprotostelium fungivorum]
MSISWGGQYAHILIENILPNVVDTKNILSIALVCRSWKDALYQSATVWQAIELDISLHLSDEFLTLYLLDSFSNCPYIRENVRALRISHAQSRYWAFSHLQFVIRFPQLRSLFLSSELTISVTQVKWFITALPELQTLKANIGYPRGNTDILEDPALYKDELKCIALEREDLRCTQIFGSRTQIMEPWKGKRVRKLRIGKKAVPLGGTKKIFDLEPLFSRNGILQNERFNDHDQLIQDLNALTERLKECKPLDRWSIRELSIKKESPPILILPEGQSVDSPREQQVLDAWKTFTSTLCQAIPVLFSLRLLPRRHRVLFLTRWFSQGASFAPGFNLDRCCSSEDAVQLVRSGLIVADGPNSKERWLLDQLLSDVVGEEDGVVHRKEILKKVMSLVPHYKSSVQQHQPYLKGVPFVPLLESNSNRERNFLALHMSKYGRQGKFTHAAVREVNSVIYFLFHPFLHMVDHRLPRLRAYKTLAQLPFYLADERTIGLFLGMDLSRDREFHGISTEFPQQEREEGLTRDQREMIEVENSMRRLFVSDRQNHKLDDLFLDLIDVYQHPSEFRRSPLNLEERKCVLLFRHFMRDDRAISHNSSANVPSIVTLDVFQERMKALTGDTFRGLDWKNVFLAGGSVLGALSSDTMSMDPGSDIDLFVYGLKVEEANKKARRIAEVVCENFGPDYEKKLFIFHSKYSITISRPWPLPHIQIILRLYKSPAEILLGFDVDCCCVGYDGEKVYATQRAQRALNKGYNLINWTRRSTTYESRLYKYALRGFGVMTSGFTRDQINPEIYTKKLNKGLGYLLSLDWGKGPSLPQNFRTRRGLRKTNDSVRLTGFQREDFKYGDYGWNVPADWDPDRIRNRIFMSASIAELNVKNEADWNSVWKEDDPGSQEGHLLTGSFQPLPPLQEDYLFLVDRLPHPAAGKTREDAKEDEITSTPSVSSVDDDRMRRKVIKLTCSDPDCECGGNGFGFGDEDEEDEDDEDGFLYSDDEDEDDYYDDEYYGEDSDDEYY